MARLSLRIGTKLGLTAGIGVALVGGMLASQMMGNQSIATLSRWVVINTANKANAQVAESAILRTQLAALDISTASSPDRLEKSLQAVRTHLASAATEIAAAQQRAVRAEAKQKFRDIRELIDRFGATSADLDKAQAAVLAGAADRAKAADAWNQAFAQLIASPDRPTISASRSISGKPPHPLPRRTSMRVSTR